MPDGDSRGLTRNEHNTLEGLPSASRGHERPATPAPAAGSSNLLDAAALVSVTLLPILEGAEEDGTLDLSPSLTPIASQVPDRNRGSATPTPGSARMEDPKGKRPERRDHTASPPPLRDPTPVEEPASPIDHLFTPCPPEGWPPIHSRDPDDIFYLQDEEQAAAWRNMPDPKVAVMLYGQPIGETGEAIATILKVLTTAGLPGAQISPPPSLHDTAETAPTRPYCLGSRSRMRKHYTNNGVSPPGSALSSPYLLTRPSPHSWEPCRD